MLLRAPAYSTHVHTKTVTACVRVPGAHGARPQHVRTFDTFTEPSRITFAQERHHQAKNRADAGIGKTVHELCVPGLPVQALHLVGQNDACHGYASGTCHLEGISLDATRYGAAQGQADLAVVRRRGQHERGSATALFMAG